MDPSADAIGRRIAGVLDAAMAVRSSHLLGNRADAGADEAHRLVRDSRMVASAISGLVPMTTASTPPGTDFRSW